MPSRHFPSLAILAIALLLLPFTASAREVSFQVRPGQSAAAPGGDYDLALEISIPPGLHINAMGQPGQDMIPTRLALKAPAGYRLKVIKAPPPEMLKLGFMTKAEPVYGGKVIVLCRIAVPPGAGPGTVGAELVLSFQACEDQMCLLPQELARRISISIVAKGKPIVRRNQRFFK